MPYSTTLPNIDEARLDAITALLVANLASLNTSLLRGGLWTLPAITSSMVSIGDPERLPLTAAEAPIILSVVGGGRYEELDTEADYRYIDQSANSGFKVDVYTNIFVYLHPDSVPAADNTWASVRAQAATRERIRSRVCDWLRAGVLNAQANLAITLGSREYSVSPGFDVLDRCRASMIYKGYFEKSFARGQQLYGAHIVHVGRVQ
jgi:hypothetical protein